jgi:acyl transferase domain-containing protein
LERFWHNLEEACDTSVLFSDEELIAAGVEPELLREPRYVKVGHVLPDIDLFDADLFKITSDEAELLDPQQRQFLECAVEALENAGYDPERFAGGIGVYAGVGMNTYLLRNLGDRYRAGSGLDRYRLMLASDKDFLATRVSYKLNLRGPSVNVNTACSTSLVAVHMACLGLLSGECEMALAGAAHIKVPQVEGYLFQDGMIFSPDGRCRAFDAAAQGTIVGSGVGIVVLKRLEDAVAHGDWIYAVIKGSAINNDGALKASYTAPSPEGQAAVISEALAVADCDPDSISYIEAHGTGTSLGDPIEVAALKQAFAGAGRGRRCALGSVKTNVGHLDVAAGMAGLIKTCLMIERKRLVPTRNFETLNPEIDLEDSPFYVNTSLDTWAANGESRRRAGVSSFGIGGTNAHVVLEEMPMRERVASEQDWQLLVVSAQSPKVLDKTTQDLARHLRQRRDLDLLDVAYTLALGRRPYRHRAALVCRDARDAALALAVGETDRLLTACAPDKGREVVFVLKGGLADNPAAGRRLYLSLPAFRKAVDLAAEVLGRDADAMLRERTETTSFVLQYALAALWISWNVRPAALIASGAATLAAGCLAGCFSLETALNPNGFSPGAPRLPLWSASVAGWMTADQALYPATWIPTMRPLVDPAALLDTSCYVPLEVSVDATLDSLLSTLGRMWLSGVDINWDAVYSQGRPRRVPLPARPFERKRFWIDPPDHRQDNPKRAALKLRQRVDAADGPARIETVVDFIQREIGRVLGANENRLPEPSANLFELGIDSLTLIEVAARLSAEMEQPVSPSGFVDHFTIRAFATNLLTSLGYNPVTDPLLVAGSVQTSSSAL